jgi:lincosamide nucleotidyltransferase A/C/D/E
VAGDDALGTWAPLGIADACAALAGFDRRWWIAGGHALELHARRSWRRHDDLDVGICRQDAPALRAHLVGWEISVAARGVLTEWDGHELSSEELENNLWCRRPGGPWLLDVLIGDGDEQRWRYRRDPSISRSSTRALRTTPDGVAHLAPGLQLLFKSVAARPKDDADAAALIPTLDPESLTVLATCLATDHPWASMVRIARRPFTAADVLEVLEILTAGGAQAWVDGGWAVDALLGAETRPHGDLDLAVPASDWVAALASLAAHGFDELRASGPHNIVVLDDQGRAVDLHAFDDTTTVLDPDGVERCGPAGLAYEAQSFCGTGSIGGREVPCISPDVLVRYHTGYAVDADDWHDVSRLCARFGLDIPPDYAAWTAG